VPATGARPLRAAHSATTTDSSTPPYAPSPGWPDVTLDAIAKVAGVGIGTLYRRFPTREASSRRRTATSWRGSASSGDLLQSMPPDEATRPGWPLRRLHDDQAPHGRRAARVIASGGNPYAQSRDRLTVAITTCSTRGRRRHRTAGHRTGRRARQPQRVSLAAAPAQRDQAGRLLDLLMDGLRYRATSAAH